MLTIRPAAERGPTRAGWLDSMHSFSFGQYFDPAHMGFGPLRVINEDHIIAGAGFGTHPHDNMEIITYVLSGELAHKDSMGNGSLIRPGDIQLMSAGTGVAHSEFNNSQTDSVHLLQIWIMPDKRNVEPGYQQKRFDTTEMQNKFRVVVSPDGADGSLRIQQNARMLTGRFDTGKNTVFAADSTRRYWLQIARGDVEANGVKLEAGDGLAITREDEIAVTAKTDAEIILFDLP